VASPRRARDPAAQDAPECAAPKAAQDAFAAALAADKAVPDSDRTALMALRAKVGCADADTALQPASAAGRDYAAYLRGADAFYKGQYDGARRAFAGLSNSASLAARNRCLHEDPPGPAHRRGRGGGQVWRFRRDRGSGQGRRAPGRRHRRLSPGLAKRPLCRLCARAAAARVLWLSGETDALAERYEALLRATPGSQEAAADLAEEIDNTLLQADGGAQAIIAHGKTPLLMAIADLKAMRPADPAKPMPLPAATLAAQAPVFAGQDDLYGLLEATRAYYAGEAPRTILARLPDAARRPIPCWRSAARPCAAWRWPRRTMPTRPASGRN
jgi:hypothetical protein